MIVLTRLYPDTLAVFTDKFTSLCCSKRQMCHSWWIYIYICIAFNPEKTHTNTHIHCESKKNCATFIFTV